MEEQLKLVHEMIDVVGRLYKKIDLTPLRYNMDKPDSFFAEIR